MHTLNTDDEFICSFRQHEFPRVHAFLVALGLQDKDSPLDYKKTYGEGTHAMNYNGTEFTMIVMQDQIHIILKKNQQFNSLQQEFLNYTTSEQQTPS